MPQDSLNLINPALVFEEIGLSRGMRVVDLGCGRSGHFTFLAARAVGDAGAVYAVDIMRESLEFVRSRAREEGFDNVQAVWSDIEKYDSTPIPAGTLDACFMMNVIFMLRDPATAIREAGRLLKAGGLLAVVEWKKRIGPLGPTDAMMVAPEKLSALAVGAGLTEYKNFAAGDYHYCMVFKKI